MARNDTVVIDSIIAQGVEAAGLTSEERGELFQRLAMEQLLKQRAPDPEEIDDGLLDGSDDGGIDGLFIAVNGQLMSEVDSVHWPKSGIEMEIWIVTCKHQDGFRQAPLDSLYASITELLDFSIPREELQGRYSEDVLRRRRDLYYAYARGAHMIASLHVTVCYACRGDSMKVGASVAARSRQIVSLLKKLFREAEVAFLFWGAAEIVDVYRRVAVPRLRLRFAEILPTDDSYLVLVRLDDFAAFVTDEDGSLREEFFDSNVRDFMGFNPVNHDIRNTLLDGMSPEFWWLNNGITILATGAAVVGKDISLEEVQIVNGLQTTECIYRHFRGRPGSAKTGSVLVKVIQSSDEAVRDAIIRSTNNQTAVDAESLYATDKVQRDIEEVLGGYGLRYERRKNYYANRRVPGLQKVTPLQLGSAYVAVGLKNPIKASSFGNGVIRNETAYRRVFGHGTHVNVWVVVAHMLKLAERVLRAAGRRQKSVGRFVRYWRHVSAFFFTARTLGGFGYAPRDVAGLDAESLSQDAMEETVAVLLEARKRRRRLKRWTVTEAEHAAAAVAKRFGLDDLEAWESGSWSDERGATPSLYEEDLAMRVNELLPEQPWQPGVHREIAGTLECSAGAVSGAIDLLIRKGIRHRQKDGVVFDLEGYVVAVDRSRVGGKRLATLRWRGAARAE